MSPADSSLLSVAILDGLVERHPLPGEPGLRLLDLRTDLQPPSESLTHLVLVLSGLDTKLELLELYQQE